MRNTLYFLAITLFLLGCANQKPITGGPIDETPPKVIRTIPQDQSTNYTGTTIVFEFDEYVQVKNLQKELIISPRIDVKYTTRIKKGTIFELRLDSALEQNTTYTFNFRDAVQDITESNPAENLKIAFSTGNVIDSLYVTGNVKNLLSNQPISEASVMLFTADDTLTLESGKPLYAAETDEEGNFRFENLKSAEYQLFALAEEDDNLRYSKREEKIGFLKQNIQVDSNVTNIALKVMDYDYQDFRLVSGRPNRQYFDFKFP